MLRKNSKDQISKPELQDSEELIFDNFSIGNATLNAGIDLNENTVSQDTHIQNNLPLSPRVKFRDSYSVPNATLAAGIDIEDNFDFEAIAKSMEYYNNVLNSNIFSGIQQHPRSRNHIQPLTSDQPLNTMMDYLSKSQPLNGRNNLLTQYRGFNHNISKSKGKEPEVNEKIKKENNNIGPFSWGTSSFSKPNYASSFSSSPIKTPKSIDNAIFDPNIYTIPSYKGKKSHNRRHSHSHVQHNNHSLTPVTKPQESLKMHGNREENEIDEPLELKIDSSFEPKQSSTAIDVQEQPIKKTIRTKRRSSRPPPPSPMDSYFGSYGSCSSAGFVGSIGTMNSSVLAKTSHYIPDASLPYLVKTIDSHLVHSENHQDSTDDIENIYNLKGGDVTRDIYVFNKKIKQNILNKRSKSEPNLYELNKKRESEFNISEISVPGGFRREFMSSHAKKEGKNPPHWITGNFIDFLALYGHYAGDDDFDEDYFSEDYGISDYEDEESEEESDEENKMNLINHDKFENNIYFDNEKHKIFETKSSYEVLNNEEYDYHNKSKLSIEIENITENTPLLQSSSHSSLNYHKSKSKKQKKSNSSSQGTASEGKTLFLLLKAFVGTGILFLPKAFSNGGIIFSLILLALSGWLTYFTMILLIRCSEKFGGSYGDIGKQLFGKPFKYMIQFSIALTQSGFCCAYIIFILQSIKSIISTATSDTLVVPDWALIAAQVLIYIPLSWVRKIQNFSISSLIADVFILIGLIYILCSDLIIISNEGHSNSIYLFNKEKFPLFLGTAIYAFEGIGLIIPLQRSMREPEKFPKVLKKSMYIIFVAMFIVGGLSYYIFGDDVHTIIFMNVFPDSFIGTIVRALYTLAIIFSFPLTCYSGIHIIEPLFIPRQRPFKSFHLKHKRMKSKNYIAMTSNHSTSEFGINKIDFNPKSNNNNSNLQLNSSPSNGEITSNGLTTSSSYSSLSGRPKRDTGKNSKIIKWMKNIFRAVFVSGLGIISYYGASNLDNFVSIIGSFACIPLMFIYPALMHYRGIAETASERATDIAIIIFGLISTVWITKLSLEEWK